MFGQNSRFFWYFGLTVSDLRDKKVGQRDNSVNFWPWILDGDRNSYLRSVNATKWFPFNKDNDTIIFFVGRELNSFG